MRIETQDKKGLTGEDYPCQVVVFEKDRHGNFRDKEDFCDWLPTDRELLLLIEDRLDLRDGNNFKRRLGKILKDSGKVASDR